MSNKRSSGEDELTLPEEAHSLITRKLRYRQREQQKQWASASQAAYSKLHEEMLANIRVQKLDRAFTAVPLTAYREIVASAMIVTKEWPGTVWETIESILSKAQLLPRDSVALNKIVDEFVWSIEQNPFTLDYVDAEKFKESVYRQASRYRLAVPASFSSQLELAAGAALSGICNHARHAREGIGIVIDEYVIPQWQDGQVGCAKTEEGMAIRITAPLAPNVGEPLISNHPGHLNHDQQMQRRANEIAVALTTPSSKPTRNKVAQELAKERGQGVDTVLRRIRKEW